MKQSIVKSCGDVNDMRNNLKELQDHIVRVMNNKGWEGIQNQEKIEVEWIEIQDWYFELRRLISFFH